MNDSILISGASGNLDGPVVNMLSASGFHLPGTIDTPANREAMPNADFSKWVSPEVIAEAIRFILSDAGRQMRQSVLKLYHKS